MTVNNRGVKGDECSCGRRASVRHCPVCGSSRLYTYAMPQWHTRLDGTTIRVDRLTRCLSCSHRFEEEDRQFCEAPPPTQKLAEQRARVLAEELAKTNPQRAQELMHQGNITPQTVAKAENESITDQIDVSQSPSVAVQEINYALQQEAEQDKTIPFEEKQKVVASRMEALLQKEWAFAKLRGKTLTPTIEEYIERRLKGELFNDNNPTANQPTG